MVSVANYHNRRHFREAPLDRLHLAPFFAHPRDIRASDRYGGGGGGGYGLDDNCPLPFHGIESLGQVLAPAPPLPSGFRVSPGTSSRRRRRRRSASPQHPLPQRGTKKISHAPYSRPSPPSPSPRRERYRVHHQRARGESSRSPRSHSSPNHRVKRSWLEAGHEGSSSGSRRRCRYEDAEWYSAERLHSSSVRDHHDHGARSLSPLHHSPSRMSPVLTPVNTPEGSKSPIDWPDSPNHYYKHDMIRFGHNGDGNENGRPDSASSAYDGSGITDRESDSKYEDHSYNALVDDFMDAVVENWREHANFDPAEMEELYQKQTKRFADLALKRYNKNKYNKVKYSLVEAIDGAIFLEGAYFYAHVNFYAKAINGPKKNGPKVLIFAELQHVGRRLNAMALRSFHFLDEKKQTIGHRHLAWGSYTSQDQDICHCYACGAAIKHPEGSGYKAGHFLAVSYYYED